MSWFAKLRIRAKLTLVTMLTTATALLLAGTAIIAFDNYNYQARKTGEISAQAGILAASVTAALEFNDPKAAQDYLNPLAANPEITAAGVYTSDGSLFARYSRSGAQPPPAPEHQVHRFEGDDLMVFWPVRQGQRGVGTVYLRTRIESLADRITSFGGIILVVMIGSLVISIPVGLRLHSVIVNPSYARSLIEASLDPMVTISPEGKITDLNEATIKATGMNREALIGTDFSNSFTAPEKAREVYQQVFTRGFVTDYPLTIRHRDGKLTDVLYNASAYKDDNGNVLGVFAAARDVTESKRVMREFTETKNFLDNILQSSIKYSIIGNNLDHHILSWNEGALRNYGYKAEEILGKSSEILHSPEDIKSGAVEKLLRVAYEKGLAEGEFVRIRKDGSRFPANVVVTRRNDASGNPIGYLLMSSDISEKKQAEEALRKAHGELELRIQERTANLESLVQQVREGIKVLGSGTSEILVATNQVASSSVETATSVSQTMATVEEVKQTVQVASQKANHVLESAQKLGQVSQTGKKSVEETIEGMMRIREQMEYIDESIMRLSEQCQAIGEIVAAVNDLSDQSNLLAVNAAIEAAKAGEQGKGFSVVAQEIKSLATQSKDATNQVRLLLGDIQKATTAAVMATEQGAKAVEAGVHQSSQASESIRLLADSITEAAHAATQIAASSQQQLIGMDQVALAMENIKQASNQNVDSTRQTESAAQKLHELGMKLKQLVE